MTRHKEIIHKLERNGISGKSNSLLTAFYFLINRKQRVILDGRNASWANVNAGGSVLGPLLFSIYNNLNI